ncbi:hypothetical protein SAMN05421553_2026 [Pseudomonas anguilliseptica]|uniref:Uncharacterized protein n=2 Tax=Pseudomonas anguilliseptica TaxID=53406 RepID=A0A1H4XW90_PSEAG|nr:hypothetical protein SAMN05421553_2026 [Pseudomonas anguilliseptica]
MQMDFVEAVGWALTLLGIFTTLMFGLVKLLLAQFEKRLAESFAAQDKARQEAGKHWDDNFTKVLERQDKDAEAVRSLEHSFLRFQAELPLQYVRREDYVRNQTVLEAKIDRVFTRLELIQERSNKQ